MILAFTGFLAAAAASAAVRIPLPNHHLTPGQTIAGVTVQQVCTPGYATRTRNVPESEKRAVYSRYRIAHHKPYSYEADHLIPLELGGANTLQNLWPEPYGGPYGARTKDRLENRLHADVCAGRLALRVAQREIAANWYRAYLAEFSHHAPTSTPTPAPAPTVEGPGSTDHSTDAEFCSTHACIPSFPNGDGTIVQCADGQWSHSGGGAGVCSGHGGQA